MWRSADSEEGFTLVEVMVAVAIAAIAMVVLFRTVTQSTSASVSVENHLAAEMLARSLLLDAAQSPVDSAFERNGRSGGFTWRLSSTALQGATARLAPRGNGLYDVKVRIEWAPRGSFELSSIVLGR